MRKRKRELEGQRVSLLQRIRFMQEHNKHKELLPKSKAEAAHMTSLFREKWHRLLHLFAFTEKNKPLVLHTFQKEALVLDGRGIPAFVPDALINACGDMFEDGQLNVSVLVTVWAESVRRLKVWLKLVVCLASISRMMMMVLFCFLI
eukprot:m.96456 g.96456  ORF g.96456 m.96456 type:complete len:147 (+) comp8967_c0_seq6:684-1124(+)